jgi:hypothetical protein
MGFYITIGVLIFIGLELLVRHVKKEREFKNRLNSHWSEPVGNDECEHDYSVVCGNRTSCCKCGKEKI